MTEHRPRHSTANL